MDPVIKQAWQAALLDPANVQTQGVLENPQHEQCCLGVLCNLAVAAGVIEKLAITCETAAGCDQCDEIEVKGGPPGGPHVLSYEFGDSEEWEGGILPHKVAVWAGLASTNPDVAVGETLSTAHGLTECNDSLKLSFPKIAELVEQL